MPEERVDVLVIGSGPAGAAMTKRLTDLGAKVVCLEQGDWVNPADYPSIHENWETALRRGSSTPTRTCGSVLKTTRSRPWEK